MIWINVIKSIIRASLPIIVLPAVFIYLIINYLGFTSDTLLAIIFLGEFYIVWAQLEVALRQTRLSVLAYRPEFKIETERRTYGINGKTYSLVNVKLKNVGKYLARNIHITTKGKNKKEYKFLTNLAPEEEVFISTFGEEVFNDTVIKIELNYEDILGNFDGITFIKEPKFPEFLVTRSMRSMPGILLNSLEELYFIFKTFTSSWRMKRMLKRAEGE